MTETVETARYTGPAEVLVPGAYEAALAQAKATAPKELAREEINIAAGEDLAAPSVSTKRNASYKLS